jgi:hypothetical protein
MVGSERFQAASPRAAVSADCRLLAGFTGSPPDHPAAPLAGFVVRNACRSRGAAGRSLRAAGDPDAGLMARCDVSRSKHEVMQP